MVQRTCSMPECDKRHRARGLCSTHYNQQLATPEQRHRKVTVQCTWCKADCEKDPGQGRKYGGLFCSLTCRDLWRKATDNNPVPSDEAREKARAALRAKGRATARRVKRAKRHAYAVKMIERAARGTQGGTWISGACAHCSTQFTASRRFVDPPRYCSVRCGDRAVELRRRIRVRLAAPPRTSVRRYSRIEIFKRDGWRCHLCRWPVDRDARVPDLWAPTIDHLLPLSKGGPDTADNVATAHFQCNSIKGARMDPTRFQLPLFGPPVTVRS